MTMSFIQKDIFFFCKIYIFVQFLIDPPGEGKTKQVVMQFQLLNQLNFVRSYTEIFSQYST